MKALFIGGTGLISSAVSKLAVARGWDITLVNRRKSRIDVGCDVEFISCDIDDREKLKGLIAGRKFDVVVEWIGFKADRVIQDVETFADKTSQYIFISSCAAYERPMRRAIVTEDLTLNNIFWDYGRDKRLCEEACMEAYREKGFPVTIVRPSLTYGDTQIPFSMNSWEKPWSLVQRMLDGKPIVCHGDGTTLWNLTHNSDFAKGLVGLMGCDKAIGETYQIVGDEILTWNEIAYGIGRAIGVEPKIVHMSSDQIIRFMPDKEGDLLGDKAASCIFDCSKLKKVVPDFVCTMPFKEGIKNSIDYFKSHPDLQVVDDEWNAAIDALIKADSLIHP